MNGLEIWGAADQLPSEAAGFFQQDIDGLADGTCVKRLPLLGY